jgi:hypothetical protein
MYSISGMMYCSDIKKWICTEESKCKCSIYQDILDMIEEDCLGNPVELGSEYCPDHIIDIRKDINGDQANKVIAVLNYETGELIQYIAVFYNPII